MVIVARHQDELERTARELQEQHHVQVHTIAKDLIEKEAPFQVYEDIKAKRNSN